MTSVLPFPDKDCFHLYQTILRFFFEPALLCQFLSDLKSTFYSVLEQVLKFKMKIQIDFDVTALSTQGPIYKFEDAGFTNFRHLDTDAYGGLLASILTRGLTKKMK